MDKANRAVGVRTPLALKWTKYIVHAADQMSEEGAMRYSGAAYRFLEKTMTASVPSSTARRTWQGSSSLVFESLETRTRVRGFFPARRGARSRSWSSIANRRGRVQMRILPAKKRGASAVTSHSSNSPVRRSFQVSLRGAKGARQGARRGDGRKAMSTACGARRRTGSASRAREGRLLVRRAALGEAVRIASLTLRLRPTVHHHGVRHEHLTRYRAERGLHERHQVVGAVVGQRPVALSPESGIDDVRELLSPAPPSAARPPATRPRTRWLHRRTPPPQGRAPFEPARATCSSSSTVPYRRTASSRSTAANT